MKEIVLKDSEFQKFSRYVKNISGINLHDGKKTLLKSRLSKILRQRDFGSFREYYDHVVNDSSGNELIILLDAISTNQTYFFREPQHFDFLRKNTSFFVNILKPSECNNISCGSPVRIKFFSGFFHPFIGI